MATTKTYYYQTPALGWLKLDLTGDGLVTTAVFVNRAGSNKQVPTKLQRALDAYFKRGADLDESLFVFPADATPFMQAVWRVIMKVPTGKTITYTDLAKKAKRPTAVRAAGTACGKNPLALFIPCHRVVRKTGEDYKYSWGEDRKRWLLQHEGAR